MIDPTWDVEREGDYSGVPIPMEFTGSHWLATEGLETLSWEHLESCV